MSNYQFWIPVIVSILAILFTGYQQCISNKQFLFDKRLHLYQMYKTLLNHQKDASLYFTNKSDEDFCMDDMLISALTNDTILESSTNGWNDRDGKSLMKTENQKAFLSMIEKLRNCGVESCFIFGGKQGKNLCSYFNKYADLCFKTYQYSIFMEGIKSENKQLNEINRAMPLDSVKSKQQPLHIELNHIYDDLCKISELIDISDLEKSISFIRRR